MQIRKANIKALNSALSTFFLPSSLKNEKIENIKNAIERGKKPTFENKFSLLKKEKIDEKIPIVGYKDKSIRERVRKI